MEYNVDSSIMQSFTPEQYRQLVEMFKDFDGDGSGSIEKKEFKVMLKKLGFEDMKKSEMKALYDGIDLNDDGVISFYEFLQIMKKLQV